jgi:hypothetical protein
MRTEGRMNQKTVRYPTYSTVVREHLDGGMYGSAVA